MVKRLFPKTGNSRFFYDHRLEVYTKESACIFLKNQTSIYSLSEESTFQIPALNAASTNGATINKHNKA